MQISFQLDGEAGVLIIEVGIFLLQLGSCPEKLVEEVEHKQAKMLTGVRKPMVQPDIRTRRKMHFLCYASCLEFMLLKGYVLMDI